ncbi:hypothetical protein TNCV_1693631 [Trichonephila clavipes]|nr:hypothetical protein TNCV_1693631 [Trichonephila clavipes]
MGNLPKHRVTLERPFFSCGIDYAGPVLIKCNKGRGTKSTKGYIALFVCLATKAAHIEAVGDLTTDSFIAALRRFSARRGAPRHIYSDNGTNFVGARRNLTKYGNWHFIPPSSPHFGGIWESGIRSVKFHLKRVLGETILTFEDSKGASFKLQPQRSLGVATEHQTGRLEEVEFEFISSLQPRKKWQDAQPNLKEDDIVLIKEEGPPGTWSMARVLQVHPGNDGLNRYGVFCKLKRNGRTQGLVRINPQHLQGLLSPSLAIYSNSTNGITAFFLNTEDLQLPQTKNETPATVEPNATASTPATVESDPTASTPTQPSTRSGRKVHLPTRYR